MPPSPYFVGWGRFKRELDMMRWRKWPFPRDPGRFMAPRYWDRDQPELDPGYLNYLYRVNQWGSRRNRRLWS